jgi:hypothetical protein
MNKLRMTGFECHYYLCNPPCEAYPEGRGPPLVIRTCLGILKKSDEFPNRTMRLNSFLYCKYTQ